MRETTTTQEKRKLFPTPTFTNILFFLNFDLITMFPLLLSPAWPKSITWLILSVTWFSPPRFGNLAMSRAWSRAVRYFPHAADTHDSTVTKAATLHRGNHSGFGEVNRRYLYNILCTMCETNVVFWIKNNSSNINTRKMYFKIEFICHQAIAHKGNSSLLLYQSIILLPLSVMLSRLPCNAKTKFKAKKIKNSTTCCNMYRGEVKSVPDTSFPVEIDHLSWNVNSSHLIFQFRD